MTRTVTLAAALALTAAALAGCGPTTAGTPTGSGPTAAGSCHVRAAPNGTLPDPGYTPGATDPHVTQASIDTTIYRPGGYTSTVRPPEAVTSVEKRSALRAHNDTAPTATYELNHLLSLELGGSPNSPHNLWPQPGASPNPKDKLETALHDLVCSHRMTLTDAQNAIAGTGSPPTTRSSAPSRPARSRIHKTAPPGPPAPTVSDEQSDTASLAPSPRELPP
jgi:hypothetical protein